MSVQWLVRKRVRVRARQIGVDYEGRVIAAHDGGFIVVRPDDPELRRKSVRSDGALYHTPEEVEVMDQSSITREEKIEELKREIALRRRVYPRFVREQRMSQEAAHRQIAVLEAILNDYVGQGDLFGGAR